MCRYSIADFVKPMNELQEIYQGYFNKIQPTLDYIKDNWGKYREYMGWKDLNSPIIHSPQILFLGINPGSGRYRSWNNGKKWNDHILPPDLPTPWRSCIGWLTPDNARVYKNGKQAHWWDDKAKLHNHLPNTMCRLLCEIYHKEQESLTKEELTEFFNKHVMVTNISPLVTEDLIALKKLYRKLDKGSPWKETERIFLNHTLRVIDLVKPQLIVYLGKYEKNLIHKDILNRGIPTVTINRSFGWHSKKNLKLIQEQITTKLSL